MQSGRFGFPARLLVGLGLLGAVVVAVLDFSGLQNRDAVWAQVASRVDNGLELRLSIPPGPYFRTELLPVTLTLTNHSASPVAYAGSLPPNACHDYALWVTITHHGDYLDPVPAPVFARVLNAEGMHFYPGYEPLYLQPMYQRRTVYGDKGCPFTCGHYKGDVRYDRGICPVTERLRDEVISTEVVRPPLTTREMDEIAAAFEKVLATPGGLLEAQEALARTQA